VEDAHSHDVLIKFIGGMCQNTDEGNESRQMGIPGAEKIHLCHKQGKNRYTTSNNAKKIITRCQINISLCDF
jgi:hypothetical protein